MKTIIKVAGASLLLTAVQSTNLFECDVDDYYGRFDPSDYSDPSELKKVVHDLIDGHVVITYGLCDEAMEVLDANPRGQGVIGIYSLEPKHPFPDEWNREHVWPRSRGIGDSGADTSDLFHLHPTDMNLNSARGNKYFDECTPGVNDCESPAGTSSEDAAEGSSEDDDVWAPPPSMRGDLARAAFYMAVRYDGSDSSTTDLKIKDCNRESSCGSNTFGRLSTLLKWHREDPVDQKELDRVNGICSDYQGNRNPFVDFPELAERLESVFGESSLAEDIDAEPVAVADDVVSPILFVSLGVVSICCAVMCMCEYATEKEEVEGETKEVRAASL